MKYIDAEKLKAEIEKRKQVHFDDYFIKKSGNPADYGASNALVQVLSLIDSLQQEQSNVELEKEFIDFLEKENAYVDDDGVISYYNGDTFDRICDIYPIARHFYELGKRNKEK